MKSVVTNAFQSTREYFTPILSSSHFTTKGVLTPSEFVLAGDTLVYKCPTWSWASGDPLKVKTYLPKDKQYLITTQVPCRIRVASLEANYETETDVTFVTSQSSADAVSDADAVSETVKSSTEDHVNDDDSWLATHSNSLNHHNTTNSVNYVGNKSSCCNNNSNAMYADTIVSSNGNHHDNTTTCDDSASFVEEDTEELNDISSILSLQQLAVPAAPHMMTKKKSEEANASQGVNLLGAVMDEHFGETQFEDMSTFEEDNLVEGIDEAALYVVSTEEPDDGNILKTRTYDLSISYDKYYQTPRVWLFGYDENSQPLTAPEIFEDIMQDYAQKTVTIEAHPHLNNVMHASIHPCQHAAVMKNIVANLTQGGKEIQIDTYLFIFLKFIQSVIPTVDYDHTMEVVGKA